MRVKVFKSYKEKVYTIKLDKRGILLFMRFNWFIRTQGNTSYLYRRYRSGIKSFHRELLKLTDKEMLVDHVDRDGLNNCIDNLRIATKSQNAQNSRKRKNSLTKYKGITFDISRNKYRARIRLKGIEKHLGRFKTEEEAALAYNKAALELFGEYANLNEIIAKGNRL